MHGQCERESTMHRRSFESSDDIRGLFVGIPRVNSTRAVLPMDVTPQGPSSRTRDEVVATNLNDDCRADRPPRVLC